MLLHKLLALCTAVVLLQATAARSAPLPDDYVWAAACKDCHSAQYSAWATTKHAHALAAIARGRADC